VTLSRSTVVAAGCLALIVTAAPLVLAQDVCPAPKPAIEGDDRRMKERHFSWTEFTDALQYIENDLPRALQEAERTEDVRNSESYAIGYPNVVTTIKGYALRQEALLRRAERDLAREMGRRGTLTKADVGAANTRFDEARRRFCDFLKNALYVD